MKREVSKELSYEITIGFKFTYAPTVYDKVVFKAFDSKEAEAKAQRYGEILRKDFQDEHCTVFISEIHEMR